MNEASERDRAVAPSDDHRCLGRGSSHRLRHAGAAGARAEVSVGGTNPAGTACRRRPRGPEAARQRRRSTQTSAAAKPIWPNARAVPKFAAPSAAATALADGEGPEHATPRSRAVCTARPECRSARSTTIRRWTMRWLAYRHVVLPTTTSTCAPDDDDRPPEREAFTAENVDRYLAAAEEAGIEELGCSEHVYRFTAGARASGGTRSGRSRRATTWTPTASSCAPPRCGSGSRWTSCPAPRTAPRNLLDGRDFDYVLGSVHFVGDRAVDRRGLGHLGAGRRRRRGLAPLLRDARARRPAAGSSTSSPIPTS